MGESELAAQLATALAEKEEAMKLALELADQRDEAMGLLVPAVAAAVGQKPATSPAKPEPAPPAKPEPPAPPLPSFREYVGMSSAQKAVIRQHYGGDFEEKAHADFMTANRLRNARGGVTPDDRRLSGQILQDREAKAVAFDPAPYYAGARTPVHLPNVVPETAAQANARAIAAAMNAGLGQGATAPARPVAPPPAPKGTGTPTPNQKVRHLGGFSVRK